MQVSGVVKWFSAVKGYGYIEPESGGRDVFAHFSEIEGEGYRNLHEGDRVMFEVVDEGRGPKARGIVVQREPQRARQYRAVERD